MVADIAVGLQLPPLLAVSPQITQTRPGRSRLCNECCICFYKVDLPQPFHLACDLRVSLEPCAPSSCYPSTPPPTSPPSRRQKMRPWLLQTRSQAKPRSRGSQDCAQAPAC